jgi:hypothetical protein
MGAMGIGVGGRLTGDRAAAGPCGHLDGKSKYYNNFWAVLAMEIYVLMN